MIFIDHNHRYLGKEYVVVRSCVFAFVIRRFNIYCVDVVSKTTDISDGAWTYVIVNEVFVPEKIVEGIPSCLKV